MSGGSGSGSGTGLGAPGPLTIFLKASRKARGSCTSLLVACNRAAIASASALPLINRYAGGCAPRRREEEVKKHVSTNSSSLAAQEMRAGLSNSDYRIRVQTTESCFVPMDEVVSVSEKAGQDLSGEGQGDERKRTADELSKANRPLESSEAAARA